MEHAWRDAALATGLISSVPTLVLPFIPQSATKPGSALQRILLCFAVGGMMGDVFLHLLPHLLVGGHHGHSHSSTHSHAEDAIHDHDHHDHGHAHAHAHDPLEGFSGEGIEDPKHGYDEAAFALLGDGETPGSGGEGHGHAHGMSDLLLPLLVLAGFMLFFISERIVRGLAGERGGHSHHAHSHGGSGSNAPDDVSRRKKDDDHVPAASAVASDRSISDGGENGRGPLKIAGILNLAADALHNLSDGIAIGAAFASGSGLGYSTALATLLHELPHEIGDFAVLVQNGMGKWQAIGAQFATALAAFAGTAIGLLATTYAGLEQPLLAATAGGFVYVSCVAVMPDILNGSPTLPQAVAEVAAMCAGIALMACVALLE